MSYGRGIASQDARGIARNPEAPKVATTDFYQLGVSHGGRVSVVSDVFWIDRSNEQVYVPDDGSLELRGPSRSYGFEVRSSLQIAGPVGLTAGFTRVMNAYYRGTSPRVYVDSAPHFVADAGLALREWRRISGSLRYRRASSYRLDGRDASVRAAGLDVADLSASLRLTRHVALSLAVDNLLDARYFETQNYFESRLTPDAPAAARIHGTPGYPRTFVVGLTLTR